MEMPETLKLWTIVRDTENKVRAYWFGSYEEFVREECYNEDGHLWVVVPFEEWTAEDLVEIFTNKIDDINYLQWSWLPNELLDNLRNNGASEYECFNIILNIYKTFEEVFII